MQKLKSCIIAIILALCNTMPVQAKQVPFTAISNPDFSKIVTIHVPDGWKHRNAEGMMELKPPKGDGWVCVEVSNLDGRTLQQMASILASNLPEGKTPEKYEGREDVWQWTTNPSISISKNLFVGSVKENIYVHFSWNNINESTIKTILANSVMADAQVMPATTGKKENESLNRIIEVQTAHELINAIASNTTIKLAPGKYVLSDAAKDAVNENNGTKYLKTPDGPQLKITGVRNLTIEGGTNAADYEIVTDPSYTAVMNLYQCENIKFVGLTMRPEHGECTGSVLSFTTCSNIEIKNCDLYGSRDGIDTFEVNKLKITGGTIRDCSRHLAVLTIINHALFTEVSMIRKSDAGPAIWLGDFVQDLVTNVVFDRVNFVNNGSPESSKIFIGSCGKGFTVKNCTSRCVNGKDILLEKKLNLGTNLSTKQIDGLGFNGEIIKSKP